MFDSENNTQNKDQPFSYKGRYGRLSYISWTFIASLFFMTAIFLGGILVAILYFLFYRGTDFSQVINTGLGYFGIALLILLVIGMIVITVNMTIRRLHDLNKSGWLILLALVPIINLFFWLYILCFKGTDGANNFGDPRPASLAEVYIGSIYGTVIAIFFSLYLVTAVVGLFVTGMNFSYFKQQIIEQNLANEEECYDEECYADEEYVDESSEEEVNVDEYLDELEKQLLLAEEEEKAKRI